jgi:serine/threonine-protein kinase
MPVAPNSRFLEALSRSPLLDSAQRAQLTDLSRAHENPNALAREIVHRGWLTAYQVNTIAKGRGRELVLGPYVVLDRLGEGGMGQVFMARQASPERLVALKVIRRRYLTNPRVVLRFQREIGTADRLDHPNVVHAYAADQIDGVYFIAMEYVEGVNLARLVKQSGPLPVWQACDLVRQAALGLQHAFECGLVHRDIKPANLLVQSVVRGPSSVVKNNKAGLSLTTDHGPRTTDYVLKITDFGLARWADDAANDPAAQLTQLGTILGTPEYIAPEQVRSSSTCDIRADLYSLGCTFYFVLTGQVPFPTGSTADKLLCHQLDKPEAVSLVRAATLANGPAHDQQVPAAVEKVIAKLMAKDPAQRYQTPAELADALAVLQASLTLRPLALPSQPHSETLVEHESTPECVTLAVPPSTIPPARTTRRSGAPRRARSEQALSPRRIWPWVLAALMALGLLIAFIVAVVVLAVWLSRSIVADAAAANRTLTACHRAAYTADTPN